METIFPYIFLMYILLFSQTTVFGSVPGLSFRENNVKDSIYTTDSLTID
ncbi:hypothetical protein [Chryseobacterium sp. POE27]